MSKSRSTRSIFSDIALSEQQERHRAAATRDARGRNDGCDRGRRGLGSDSSDGSSARSPQRSAVQQRRRQQQQQQREERGDGEEDEGEVEEEGVRGVAYKAAATGRAVAPTLVRVASAHEPRGEAATTQRQQYTTPQGEQQQQQQQQQQQKAMDTRASINLGESGNFKSFFVTGCSQPPEAFLDVVTQVLHCVCVCVCVWGGGAVVRKSWKVSPKPFCCRLFSDCFLLPFLFLSLPFPFSSSPPPSQKKIQFAVTAAG